MKDKILEIIENSITVSPSGISVIRTGHAAEEIAQMFCDYLAWEYRMDSRINNKKDIAEALDDWNFTQEQIDKAIMKLTI